MKRDMSLTNITKKPFLGLILNCNAKCHLETHSLNSYSSTIILDVSMIVNLKIRILSMAPRISTIS